MSPTPTPLGMEVSTWANFAWAVPSSGGLQPCWVSGCKSSSQAKSSTKWLDHGRQGVEEWVLPWKSTITQSRLSVGKKQCFKGPGQVLEQADLKALRPLETGNITSQARNCCLGDKVGQHKDKEKWEDIPRPTSSRAPIS